MANKTFFYSDSMPNVRCTQCCKYLSVPPIIIRSNSPICGRCIKFDRYIAQDRAHFYEDLAASMIFPCVNDIYGCPVKTPFNKVLGHEVKCKFPKEISSCPVPGCDSEIGFEQVMDHCNIRHEDCFVHINNCPFPTKEKIEYSRQQSTSPIIGISLFIWNNQLFVMETQLCQGDFYLRISCFAELKFSNVKLRIHGKRGSGSVCLNKIKIKRYNGAVSGNYSAEEKIDICAMQNILGPEIRCELDFGEENESDNIDIVNEMLSELECPVCTNYMKPPILMCSLGHSLCQKCRNRLSKCPSCSEDFIVTRNYSLEKISEIVIRHCKYQGCDFRGNFKEIEFHESSCPSFLKNEIDCFLNNLPCTWRGRYTEVFQHISQFHPDRCLLIDQGVLLDDNMFNKPMKKWFLEYDQKVFELCMKETSIDLYWSMSYITNPIEDCKDKYMLYIDFANGNRTFRMNLDCQPISRSSSRQLKEHTVTIPVSFLQPFSQHNTYRASLNIVKYE